MCSIDISDEKRVNFVFYWDSIEVEKKTNQHPTINPLFFLSNRNNSSQILPKSEYK